MPPRGMWARSVITTTWRMHRTWASAASSTATKARSTKTSRSSAWSSIQAICSGGSRGLTVWHTAPMPEDA